MNPPEDLLSKIGSTIFFIMVVVFWTVPFTLVYLTYFLVKTIVMWLFFYEKPKQTFAEWWLANNKIFGDSALHNKDGFTEMEFESIGELWVIEIDFSGFFTIKGPNTPFGVIVFISTALLAIGIMHQDVDHPVLNFFRISGILVYAVWIVFFELRLMYVGWSSVFNFSKRNNRQKVI